MNILHCPHCGHHVYVRSGDTIGFCPVCNQDVECENESNYDLLLWNTLKEHRGHHIYIASYGDSNDPVNISLECEDCGAIVLDAGLYTICARKDI